MIEIDGSHGEGGGQVIRTSLSLAAITQIPVRITNIRAGRPNPGLQAQHLTATKAVRNICRGSVEGAELSSPELVFRPGPIIGGKYDFNIGTAGSITLVAQTLIPILLHASKPSSLRIIGGSHVMKAPSYDYFERIFVPAMQRFGLNLKTKLNRLGFYPRGGAEMELETDPTKLQGVTAWERGDHPRVLIRLSQLPMLVGVREKKVFVQNNIEDIMVWEQPPAVDVGNSLLVWQGTRGVGVLGEKGKRSEQVGQEALDEFRKETGDVDKHLADQLLLYATLADGETRYLTSEITEHTRTNADIIQKFLPKRKIELDNGQITIR